MGAVQVDEGQIAYFGPLTGGTVAVRDLQRLRLDGGAKPGPLGAGTGRWPGLDDPGGRGGGRRFVRRFCNVAWAAY